MQPIRPELSGGVSDEVARAEESLRMELASVILTLIRLGKVTSPGDINSVFDNFRGNYQDNPGIQYVQLPVLHRTLEHRIWPVREVRPENKPYIDQAVLLIGAALAFTPDPEVRY